MQFLVMMTTHVPDGTPEATVTDVRTREAAHSSVLAGQGHLLRLWRPPLLPGEWRSIGLFAADDEAALERVLVSMPLRIWRADEVTALRPHPNDPDQPAATDATEFLTTFTTVVPKGTPRHVVEETEAREAERARELGQQGYLERLWTLPGPSRVLGLWRARDAADMEAVLETLPLDDWMNVQTTPLSPHPSDPALVQPTRM